MRFLHILSLILLCLISCEPPQTATGGGVSQPPDQTIENIVEDFQELTVEFQELARPNYVEAWVDQLIVKSQPGTDMPEIARMREGEVARYLKQRTLRKTEFKLRGQRYYEPWLLVRTKDSIMGWVHQGGVRFVQQNFLTQLIGEEQMRTRGLDATPAATQSKENTVIVPGRQVGPIQLNTSEEELIKIFGPSQVQRGTINTSEVNIEQSTIIYPNTRDEIHITWKDQSRSEVKAIYFTRADSKWYTQRGLTVGMDLLALTKVNEGPINFYGFNWEYGGTVNSWRKGTLDRFDKYFYVVLSPRNPTATKSLIQKFSGNNIYSSNTEGVEQLDLVVSRVVVYLD